MMHGSARRTPLDTARRLTSRPVLPAAAAAALVAALVIGDRPHSAHDALDECVELSRAVARCFPRSGEVHAPPAPTTEESRIEARKRCTADRVRIERACR